MRSKLNACKIIFPLFLFCCACKTESAPDEQILIRNDLLDKEYNVIVVDDIRQGVSAVGIRISLKPGQRKLVKEKGITHMRFSREYKDHTKIYEVTCPSSKGGGVVINLIDIASNRIGGGCELTKRGKRNYGGMTVWEEEK